MRVALALGGGAALGFAHIGVARVLAAGGIAVGAVAGTSMGAIAAGALASGRMDAFEAEARGAHLGRVLSFLDPMLGPGAVLGGRRIARALRRHFDDLRIEALAIPASFVAADLMTGEEVRIAAGPLLPAILASIAIPALFRPVALDGRLLIDGGMVANLPVSAARAAAPQLPIVAVDLMGDFAGHTGDALAGGVDARHGAFRVGRAAFLMMMTRQAQQTVALERPDVLIQPRIGHLGTGAFTRADDLIRLGEAAANAALPAIRAACAAQQTGSPSRLLSG